jgi:hypothetical protein
VARRPHGIRSSPRTVNHPTPTLTCWVGPLPRPVDGHRNYLVMTANEATDRDCCRELRAERRLAQRSTTERMVARFGRSGLSLCDGCFDRSTVVS